MLPLALAAAPQALLGLYQILKGNKEMSKLHKQAVPQFGETPAMAASRARAEDLAQGGFTGAEKAGFRKNIAEDINTQSRKALDIGGGSLGRVISGMGKINTMGAESRFAQQDAELHRNNIRYADTFSQKLQNIADMNIDQQLRQRMMAEQALGGAVKAGTENLTGGLSTGLALGLKTDSTGSKKEKITIGAPGDAVPNTSGNMAQVYDPKDPFSFINKLAAISIT